MTVTPRPVVVAATVLVVAIAAGGCGAVPNRVEDEMTISPLSAALDACLRAGSEHIGFPLGEVASMAVHAERDDQGWWAVEATAGDAPAVARFTCTAVPDGEGGVRAASFGVAGAS